jgi:hypothetical protein
MDNIFVKPAVDADGNALLVRHPAKGYAALPPEGDYWPQGTYTTRRLRDGDVVEAEPPVTVEVRNLDGSGLLHDAEGQIVGAVVKPTDEERAMLSALDPDERTLSPTDDLGVPVEPQHSRRNKRNPSTEV